MSGFFVRFFSALATLLFFIPLGSTAAAAGAQWTLANKRAAADASASTEFQITIDPLAHQTYGLYYPVTYMFQVPAGSSNLTAQYSYAPAAGWTTLTAYTSADFFNGVNAVRFDYGNSLAYLSVSFSSSSDAIYVRILNGQSGVPVSFSGIPLYYDNRHAAVTVTLDDWAEWSDSDFNIASGYLTAARVHYSVGINSEYGNPDDGPDWALIQSWYNLGYLEPAAHTRTHPCSDEEYQVNGYDWEITGIRDDILTNLNLLHPYVPVFIEPCGFESAAVRQAVANAHYLADRSVSWGLTNFASWGADGTYQPALITYEAEPNSMRLAVANSYFDGTYAEGGIYHLFSHPWQGLFYDNSDLVQHVNYISNRLDVWYAAFGELYLYHYVQERGQVSVLPAIPDTALLSVSKPGTGSGTVTSVPSGIDCGTLCTASFDLNTPVTLTTEAGTGSTFTGWAGSGCSGTGACQLTMDAAKSVTATFTLNSYALTVGKSGKGSGSVTSVPSGIDCGTTCAASFDHSTLVTLTAVKGTGSTFTGWSGSGCSGTSTCSVTMDEQKLITAIFTTAKVYDDFDGDGKSDPVKYDPATNRVSWLKSSDGTWDSADMGTDSSSYVPRSDFDGDGRTDPAKYVSSNGSVWYIKSGTGSWEGQFVGSDPYTYVSGADYDGDGMTDPAKFVSSVNALWYLQSGSSTWQGVYMGPGSFTLVNGSDYDGDGKTDPALFVSSVNALWYMQSSTSTWQGVYMGPGSYSMVPASDFDGDGKTDPAQFDASAQVLWYQGSSTSTWQGVYMGSGTYSYVSGCDFDGDGKTDPAKFDPGTHVLWYLQSSTSTWQAVDMGSGTYDLVN